LQHSLAGNHTLAMILVETFASVRLEYGRERFLKLQQQRIIILVRQEQNYRTASSDTANPNYFPRYIDDTITV
jgi:hypothetical protein